jgi:methylenetetrahydrofolate dehydrogenase (NADP+)/methenyltetrahydrofolate cyclohydrolase
MTATILDGELLAGRFKMEVGDRVARLKAEGRQVALGPSSSATMGPARTYVAMKHADCAEVGIESRHIQLGADASEDDVFAAVAEMNADTEVASILVQLPLPAGMDEERVLLAVDPAKDVDGLHPVNLGKLVMGVLGHRRPARQRASSSSCTPTRCPSRASTSSSSAGASPSAGRSRCSWPCVDPAGTWRSPWSTRGSTTWPGLVRQADVVVAAAGVAGLVTKDMVKPGAAVVGAGASWEGKRLMSDVDESVAEVAGWITPRSAVSVR